MSETLCFHSVFTTKALLWLTLLSPHFFQLQNEVQITSKFLPALNIVYDVLSFSEDRAVACTPSDGSQCGYINSMNTDSFLQRESVLFHIPYL